MKQLIENKEYQQELEKLIAKMKTSISLAKRFPCFKDYILKNKVQRGAIGSKYKDMYLDWKVNIVNYDGINTTMTNNKENPTGEYICIYINTLTLYNSHEHYGLDKLTEKIFYFDKINSTFYIEPSNLCDFMEILYTWYLKAKKQLSIDKKEQKKKELQKQLNALNT